MTRSRTRRARVRWTLESALAFARQGQSGMAFAGNVAGDFAREAHARRRLALWAVRRAFPVPT